MTNRIKRCDKCNTILQKNVIHDCRLDCKHCGKIFSNKDMVRNHIKMDHDKETERSIYECDICGLKLFRKNCLRIHMEKKHADGKIKFFTCDFDGKKFKTKAEIRKHIAVHLPYVKCDFCSVKLNLEYLKLNVRNVHSGIKRPVKKSIPKKFILQCPICPKILASKSGLYRHIHDHNKKIKCKFCEKLFGIQSRLKDHIREYHENPRSYVCNICDKKFSRAEHLKVHIKTHDPNRQRGIKCSQCDYATDRNSSLKIHLNFHSKKNAQIAAIKNPHQCSQCPSVFGRKDLLRYHIRAVHPKAKLERDICGRKIQIKRHLKNVHKIGS